jgi:hypothetical protein
MGGFTLDVVASAFEDDLVAALDVIGTLHGGIVLVDHFDTLARRYYHRRYLDIVDCGDSLGSDIEWLRRTFTGARITLRGSAS